MAIFKTNANGKDNLHFWHNLYPVIDLVDWITPSRWSGTLFCSLGSAWPCQPNSFLSWLCRLLWAYAWYCLLDERVGVGLEVHRVGLLGITKTKSSPYRSRQPKHPFIFTVDKICWKPTRGTACSYCICPLLTGTKLFFLQGWFIRLSVVWLFVVSGWMFLVTYNDTPKVNCSATLNNGKIFSIITVNVM